MVLGSLFMHRDSAARRLWRGGDEPQREFQGFPMRTALLLPPPVACSVWWCSYRFKVDVPTPEGWGRIGEDDGVMCGWIALAGWVLLLLAVWWDGYVAAKLRRSNRRAAAAASADADGDATADPAKKPTPHAADKIHRVRSKKTD
jgi:hypothetical protein